MFGTGEDKIPHGLHMLLETMKKQYLAMIQTMQSKQYSDNIIKVNNLCFFRSPSSNGFVLK